MARKTDGTASTDRRKKAQVPNPPAAVQVTPKVHLDVPEQVRHQQVAREPVGREEVRKDAPKETPKDTPKDTPKNGTPANHVSVNLASANLASANVNVEEQIRRRAYELYLQRRATAGGTSGDQNQDWLIAEREIRSNHGDRGQFAAAAGRA